METWELWYPNAAAQGMLFGRSRIEHREMVLVHAAPEVLRVEVRDDAGSLLAFADQLARAIDKRIPMTRLRRIDGRITRSDEWPSPADQGAIVLLAGGEAGVLRTWWSAPDEQEWRWTLEFYNRP